MRAITPHLLKDGRVRSAKGNLKRLLESHGFQVKAGNTCLGDFAVGPAPVVSRSLAGVNVLITADIDADGALKISTEYDDTQKEFENFARV